MKRLCLVSVAAWVLACAPATDDAALEAPVGSGGSSSAGAGKVTPGGSGPSSGAPNAGTPGSQGGAAGSSAMAGEAGGVSAAGSAGAWGGSSGGAAGAAGAGDAGSAGTAPSVPEECGVSSPVSFKKDVEPFLTASCGKGNGSGCHVTDASSTKGSLCPDGTKTCGFDHAYDWITAGSHNEFCNQSPAPIRYTVVMAVLKAAKPASCTESRVMPPEGPAPTVCQLATLGAWLAQPKVLHVHRADDTSPDDAYLMPPFN